MVTQGSNCLTFVNGTKLPKGGQAMLDKGSVIGLGPRVKLKFNAY